MVIYFWLYESVIGWASGSKSMRKIIPLVAVILLLPDLSRAEQGSVTNTSQDDAELRQKIIGTWATDGLCLKGSTTFVPDGMAVSQNSVVSTNCNVRVATYIEETWQIQDSVMTATVTKSSNPDLTPVGWVSRARIIRIDDGEAVTVTVGIGVTVTNVASRIK
jgi:hypothetical protein